MKFRNFENWSDNPEDYHIDDLDVFVWKSKMKDKKFSALFESITKSRLVTDFCLVKVKGEWKWRKK